MKQYNKVINYPNLNPQQLLSLIRANQIMITDLEEQINNLQNKLILMQGI